MIYTFYRFEVSQLSIEDESVEEYSVIDIAQHTDAASAVYENLLRRLPRRIQDCRYNLENDLSLSR